MPVVREQRIGHVPMWPEYSQQLYPDRQLGILDGHTLFFEKGTPVTVTDFAELMNVVFERNCTVFIESLSDTTIFPFLNESVVSGKVLCNAKGWPAAVRYEYKKSSRWLVPASSWERHIDESFLPSMREVYRYFKVGVKPTPGSLAAALLRRSWQVFHYQRHSSPNAGCRHFLWRHTVGGRCDLFAEKESFYASCLELDMSSAYLAHFLILPTGTSHHFMANCVSKFATYFARCTITVHSPLALGPFPVRKKAKVMYPTRPGIYETYLWKEQVEDCIEAGCFVELHGGYGWTDLTTDTESWARDMYTYRISAEFAGNDNLIWASKKLAVSGIGRFGMHNTFYHLVSEANAQGKDVSFLGSDFHACDYYVHEEKDYTKANMCHWYSYCIMQCARSLYRCALPYAIEGRLLMTNYDALLIVEKDEQERYAEKHTLESMMCEMGDLRWQRLTNVTILGQRSLKCDQKVIRPGVSGVQKEVA